MADISDELLRQILEKMTAIEASTAKCAELVQEFMDVRRAEAEEIAEMSRDFRLR